MSCLFNSLSRFVPETSAQLRNRICNFLQQNSERVLPGLSDQVLFGMPKAKYVENMRRSSTWGGAIEIRAFCQIYNFEVEVVNIRRNGRALNRNASVMFLAPGTEPKQRARITWNGNHYEPLPFPPSLSPEEKKTAEQKK